MSDEYVIGFLDTAEVWRELTFRGVTQDVAVALAQGLDRAAFENVTLTSTERITIDLNAPATEEPAPVAEEPAPVDAVTDDAVGGS